MKEKRMKTKWNKNQKMSSIIYLAEKKYQLIDHKQVKKVHKNQHMIKAGLKPVFLNQFLLDKKA